ncbi:hypothetical protein [Endozoicomonas sp. 4G]|uniref:hypothetical protein n=1 Tax=Endozoicomonas sp. 4G TaxID=2872754 RepID=UPI002078DD91|nr:hypothetical protein [Endozoicomonas sp. 4G]
MFCQTCNSGKFTFTSHDPSSFANKGLKSSIAGKNSSARKSVSGKKTTQATNPEIPAPELDSSSFTILLMKDEDGRVVAHVQLSDMAWDAIERGGGKQLLETIDKTLRGIRTSMKLTHLKVVRERRGHLKKVLVNQNNKKTVLKLRQALLSAGAEEIRRIPIHDSAIALTLEKARKIRESQWPNLSGTGMVELVTAEFQSVPLMDLSSVFQAIQAGNMIPLIITSTEAAHEGNQAAAGTVTSVMLGAIIADPANSHTGSTDMLLLMGNQPLHITQNNLMNILTAIVNALGEDMHNVHSSLHLLETPQTHNQDNPDHLSSVPNIEDWINRAPNLGGSAGGSGQ